MQLLLKAQREPVDDCRSTPSTDCWLSEPRSDEEDLHDLDFDQELGVSLQAAVFRDAASNLHTDVKLAADVSPTGASKRKQPVSRQSRTFSSTDSYEQVFTTTVLPICKDVIQGRSGALIACGHVMSECRTIIGDGTPMVPRIINTLFAGIAHLNDWCVEVSFVEVSNSTVRDLLAPQIGPRPLLQVTASEVGKCKAASEPCSYKNAVRRFVPSPEAALEALQSRPECDSDRRSHLVFSIVLEHREAPHIVARRKLDIVDLDCACTDRSLEDVAFAIRRIGCESFRGGPLTHLLESAFQNPFNVAVLIAEDPVIANLGGSGSLLAFSRKSGVGHVAENEEENFWREQHDLRVLEADNLRQRVELLERRRFDTERLELENQRLVEERSALHQQVETQQADLKRAAAVVSQVHNSCTVLAKEIEGQVLQPTPPLFECRCLSGLFRLFYGRPP
mmetsp:Transcript_73518/g.137370  ORF Transcript_73518/g.137370 Transcript_73518/m.137370 type:complete len:450 (-) Transcript_73518:76-1425(-)